MQILLATEVILRLDVAMDSRLLSTEERALRHLLKKKLQGLASLERTLACQRSRLLWLREGDACTRFFHTHASHRRRKNFIGHLMVDNRRVTDNADKAEAVDSFFEGLLGTSADRPFSLDLDYLGIPSIDLRQIDGEFFVDEVRRPSRACPWTSALVRMGSQPASSLIARISLRWTSWLRSILCRALTVVDLERLTTRSSPYFRRSPVPRRCGTFGRSA
jgi:hypothetical protein